MRSRSLLWSFDYAIQGIIYALRTQRNMRLHALATGVVLFGALWFRISRFELIALLFAIAFVLVAELANTALETVVDLSAEGFDPSAKIAKDVAAGAVLVASMNALAVGYVVFFGHLTRGADRVLTLVRESPEHVTLVALALTALAVLVLKALSREGGTFLRGGWPSGHTALATAAATAIGFVTESAGAAVLGMFAAALVAQSRVESGTHSIPQVVAGAAVGLAITTAVFRLFFV